MTQVQVFDSLFVLSNLIVLIAINGYNQAVFQKRLMQGIVLLDLIAEIPQIVNAEYRFLSLDQIFFIRNTYTLVFTCLLTVFFSGIIKLPRAKPFVLLTGALIVLTGILRFSWTNDDSFTLTTMSIWILVCGFLYLYSRFDELNPADVTKEYIFWFVAGMVFYYFANQFRFISLKYLVDNPPDNLLITIGIIHNLTYLVKNIIYCVPMFLARSWNFK